MANWYTLSARFTSEEMAILEDLKERYDLNHNQSLRKGTTRQIEHKVWSEFSPVSEKGNRITRTLYRAWRILCHYGRQSNEKNIQRGTLVSARIGQTDQGID